MIICITNKINEDKREDNFIIASKSSIFIYGLFALE